jgi:cytochrome c oxidase subunit 2
MLEIIWVAIPTVIVSILAAYAWIVLDDVEAKQPNELRVVVKGQQFAWRFEYPEYDNLKSNELYLPKDRPVKFDIDSDDVLHSFWVPSFRLKIDAVPGLTTFIRLTPSRLGKYDIVCAELCGIGHSTMRQYTYVVEEQEFEDWVAEQSEEAAGEGESASSGANTIPDAG